MAELSDKKSARIVVVIPQPQAKGKLRGNLLFLVNLSNAQGHSFIRTEVSRCEKW